MGTAAAAATNDRRNEFEGRRDALFRCYVALVVAGGAAVLAGAAARLQWTSVAHLGPAFALVVLFVVFGELRPLFTAGSRDANGLVVSTAFIYALLLRFGLPVAVLLQAVGTAVVDTSKRKAVWRTAFNTSQYTLSWAASAATISLLGRTGGADSPLRVAGGELAAAAAGGVAYFVVNQVLVAGALALKLGTSFRVLVTEDLGYEALTTGALLALAPLVALAIERGVLFVPLLVPPLVAVYKVASVALDREHEAHSDALTGLPNRTLLAQRAGAALQAAPDGRVALLLLDLDHFKEVNDTLGHHVGDRLLQVVAERLTAAVRPGDTVARLGGDEFAVLVTEDQGEDGGVTTALRLRAALSEPIVLEGLLVDVGASIGVAVSPRDGRDLEDLLQHADVAMYLAKQTGTGVEAYDVSRDENSTGRLALLGELRQAVSRGELELHYLPVVGLCDGAVTGVEALVRWRHPVRGLLAPADFLPLAERSDLARDLTAWVLDTALAELARWSDDGVSLRLAVNVGARDLTGGLLAQQVAAGLAAHGVEPHRLVLEVNEGAFAADPDQVAATLHALVALGVGLSLDDFGSGWSSFGHLRDLPVREVKVDRGLVERMAGDARDHAVVRSVIELATGLGLEVVAEGVEREDTARALAALGCGSVQGWWLSKALPAPELSEWLRLRVDAPPLPTPRTPPPAAHPAAHPAQPAQPQSAPR